MSKPYSHLENQLAAVNPLTKRQIASAGLRKLKKLAHIAYKIRMSKVYEDRLDYDIDDFMSGYEMEWEDARVLRTMLHSMD